MEKDEKAYKLSALMKKIADRLPIPCPMASIPMTRALEEMNLVFHAHDDSAFEAALLGVEEAAKRWFRELKASGEHFFRPRPPKTDPDAWIEEWEAEQGIARKKPPGGNVKRLRRDPWLSPESKGSPDPWLNPKPKPADPPKPDGRRSRGAPLPGQGALWGAEDSGESKKRRSRYDLGFYRR